MKKKKKRIIYKYDDYHKKIDEILHKKCAYHDEFFPGENPWFPCTTEYYYKNSKNKQDGLYPECKRCSKTKNGKMER